MKSFQPGQIVRARDREWVVQPGSNQELLLLQPLVGEAGEETAILLTYDKEYADIEHAGFPAVDSENIGDQHGARLLQLSSRITNRNTVGPFLSLGRIAVKPRDYQLVPLLLALRQDPTRMLIADDVGIGKTVESLLIARELWDRGEIQRILVLCPPHLAHQWKRELERKFNFAEVEMLLSETARRLEREVPLGQSVFDVHKVLVVSLDYIKNPDRRSELLRCGAEFVIVDEAHTCTKETDAAAHQRYEVVKSLSESKVKRPDGTVAQRHLVLVTATPHTGKPDSFKRLLSLLEPDLANIPDQIEKSPRLKDTLAKYFVQRRRNDIRKFVDENETPFPKRMEKEKEYFLTAEQKQFLRDMGNFFHEKHRAATTGKQKQNAFWTLQSLLNTFSSSPKALVATLQSRAPKKASGEADVAEPGEPQVEDGDGTVRDQIRGGAYDEETVTKFQEWADKYGTLLESKDAKLQALVKTLKEWHAEGRRPIVFCHYIPTAEYVAEALTKAFPGHAVRAVSGHLNPQQREDAIAQLVATPKDGTRNRETKPYILVATDCLSEGINLQEWFDSVVHYDLSWVPTRHEQRDGRVDRFLQKKKEVYSLTLYSQQAVIDKAIMAVLQAKQKAIRDTTGVYIPSPRDTTSIQRRVVRDFLEKKVTVDLSAFGIDVGAAEELRTLETEWRDAAERQSKFTTKFAQSGISGKEVKELYDEVQGNTCSPNEVRDFMERALRAIGGGMVKATRGFDIDITGAQQEFVDRLPEMPKKFRAEFHMVDDEHIVSLDIAHPFVVQLANYVIARSIASENKEDLRRRAGCIRTKAVTKPTILYLVRHRYLMKQTRLEERVLEEIKLHAIQDGVMLDDEPTLKLLDAQPSASIPPQGKKEFLAPFANNIPTAVLRKWEETRCKQVGSAHDGIRGKTGQLGGAYKVVPYGQAGAADIIGSYLFLPGAAT